MRNFLKTGKKKATVRAAELKAREDETRKVLQVRIDGSTKKMLNSSCAINNREKCFAECTHFKEGYVNEWQLFDDLIIEAIYPKCKLWK